MPTHRTRYSGEFFSSNGRRYRIKIYDKNYSGQTIPITIGGGGVKIKYDTSGQEKFSPIIASKCAVSVVVENNPFGVHLKNFIKDLRTTYEEGDATVVIWNDPSIYPVWSGNILLDLSSKEDVSMPYEVSLNATDGIGLLKNFDMVSVQGANPYAADDTYISDGSQTFIYWIKTILEYCNTPDGDSTDGDVPDYTFSTSMDWWYEEHPTATASISPLAYTNCMMLGSYELKEDGTYKVQSVYKVLESICKMWGMRLVFWRNRFYFVQLELYETTDSGSFVAPENIDSQIWARGGTLQSGNNYLGDPWWTLYSQDIETNAGGFSGGLQKLAGSTWDYYPKLKEVSVDFVSISSNNYFQRFPQPHTLPLTDQEDNLTSSPLGVITNASTFGGFNVKIDLAFFNSANALNVLTNFSIRARPDGDTDWDNAKYLDVQPGVTPTWEDYPVEAAGGADAVWCDYFIAQGASVWTLYQQYNQHPNAAPFAISSAGNQHTIFNAQIPTDAAFSGDWEFELFTIRSYFVTPSLNEFTGGHHTVYGNPSLTISVSTTTITYSDVLDANNNPTSQFNPILNNIVGGSLSTIVYSGRSETQRQQINDIWWGDTLTNGEPSSLIWDNGAGSTGYTDPTGKWRRGQTGAFDKSLGELLAESRLYFQQTSDYKWSLQTAVSEKNSWINDGSASRPVYVNPVGRIHDTRDRIFYYLLRGTFDLSMDEWGGEWVQISYDDSISTTTTTPTTGGSSDDNHHIEARLAGPRASFFGSELNMGSLSTRVAAWSTVTSLRIEPMNPIVFEEEGETTLYLFEQNTLIKSGDIFNIVNSNGIWQQFTASADVANTDTTISVVSVDIEKPLEVGSKIVVNIRDSYQQINHKTRGTIHLPQYSLSESSSDPADPAEGNAVIWMSDGTASGEDGDIITKIKAGGVVKRFTLVDFTSFTNTYSIDFDGVDDYIDVDSSASAIDEDLGSISLWIKLDSVSVSVTAFQAAVDTNNFIRVWYKNGDSTLRFQTKRGGTATTTYYAGGVEADGNWHHLAMTWDFSSNELKGYLDGVARGGTGAIAGTWSGSLSLVHIGKLATSGTNYWEGNIDEVGIWDSVLTAAEITEIYNSGTPLSLLKDTVNYSSSADLIGWWRMGDSATYPTIPDDSTNSNNGTMTNMSADDIVQDIPE